jgi:hypothetical protein
MCFPECQCAQNNKQRCRHGQKLFSDDTLHTLQGCNSGQPGTAASSPPIRRCHAVAAANTFCAFARAAGWAYVSAACGFVLKNTSTLPAQPHGQHTVDAVARRLRCVCQMLHRRRCPLTCHLQHLGHGWRAGRCLEKMYAMRGSLMHTRAFLQCCSLDAHCQCAPPIHPVGSPSKNPASNACGKNMHARSHIHARNWCCVLLS